MIVFRNNGQIDVRCVTTFGVSSKATDAAIGYFGTGLKYAIAICLREGCEVALVTDGRRYTFAHERSKIRLHEFDIVTMNGEPLAFTLELGKNWELWQAYRELWCNTKDECGSVHLIEDHDCSGLGDPDSTYVVVRGSKFENIYRSRHLYFLDDYEIKTSDGHTEAVVSSGGGRFFYKGILVSEHELTCLYDYNFLNALDCGLTEDRTMQHEWQRKWNVQALTMQSEDRDFIAEMLTASPLTFEGALDYSQHCRAGTKAGEVFLDVIGELRREQKDHDINISAIVLHRRMVEHSILPTESIGLNTVEAAQLTRARRFCIETLGLDLDAYPLIVCEDLGAGDLGRADMKLKVMYISRKCFADGTKRVACALLEEYTHLRHDVEDETLQQKWIYLQQILSLGEQLQGEPL